MPPDDEKFKVIMVAEQKVDIYSGNSCAEHKPFWWGYADGDKDAGDIDNPLTLDLAHFPPGTKIEISVPVCPSCGLDRDFTHHSSNSEKCDCGYDWKNRDEIRYS